MLVAGGREIKGGEECVVEVRAYVYGGFEGRQSKAGAAGENAMTVEAGTRRGLGVDSHTGEARARPLVSLCGGARRKPGNWKKREVPRLGAAK